MPKVKVRLLVTLPVVLTIFTFASGLFGINLMKLAFLPQGTKLSLPGGGRSLVWTSVQVAGVPAEVWVVALSLFGALTGLLLAHGITSPLKRRTAGAEALLTDLHVAPSGPAPNEVGLFADLFDQTLVHLGRFARDHHLIEELSEGVLSLDAQGKVTGMNKTAGKILQVAPEAAQGLSYRDLLPSTPENESFVRLFEGNLVSRKERLLERVSITSAGGRQSSFWVKVSFLPENGSDGGMVVTFRDLAEVERIRTELARTDYLASLGSMAAVLAHEIRNPLGSLRGFAELLQADLPQEDKKSTYVESILEETDRLSRLVEELLSFAKPSPSQIQPHPLKHLLSQALQAARKSLQEKEVDVIEEWGENSPMVMADGEKFCMAFTNLLANAFDAVSPGGKVTLSVVEKSPSEVAVKVTNTGSYIAEEKRAKIFEPFYTTKTKGVGLGLAITQRIIAAHGGEIEVESNPEEGTTFTVELPLAI
jgi:two-component system, NtrC family, sensor histidine kinase AtoS